MLILVRLFHVMRIAANFCSLNLILFLNVLFMIFFRSEFEKFSASRMVFPLSWLAGHLQIQSLLLE
jgi:hypothetical protein